MFYCKCGGGNSITLRTVSCFIELNVFFSVVVGVDFLLYSEAGCEWETPHAVLD